jgi:hypothetical protein
MSCIFCVKCKRDMTCIKMGVGVNYGYGHVYPGDLYECPECKFKMIWTIGHSVHDGNYDQFVHYFDAREAELKVLESIKKLKKPYRLIRIDDG